MFKQLHEIATIGEIVPLMVTLPGGDRESYNVFYTDVVLAVFPTRLTDAQRQSFNANSLNDSSMRMIQLCIEMGASIVKPQSQAVIEDYTQQLVEVEENGITDELPLRLDTPDGRERYIIGTDMPKGDKCKVVVYYPDTGMATEVFEAL